MTDKGFIKSNRHIELLAPAGSKESFYAGLRAGADAVYLAYEKFGARAYAGNFDLDALTECIDHAHLYGKKVYLTVNTLFKEKEFEDLARFAETGVPSMSDGLIIQDLGVASFFRDKYPLIPLHASTQMSVTGPEGASFLRDMGFSRVVPARELSFEEIRRIYDCTGIDIECFIHGAMCYSYSGQCLFSSILGGRSGNRGRCAQPCRLSYRLAGKGKDTETYPLSLKDMCTLEILPMILEAGVCSLKVEGRMKPAEYVDGVISIYRKYLDLYLSGDEYRIDPADLKKLSGLYVRGDLSHGYYDRHNSRDMVTITSHGYNGSDDSEDKDKKTSATCSDSYRLPGIPVSFEAVFRIGKEALLKGYAETIDGRKASALGRGSIVEKSLRSSVSDEDIRKSLRKLGNTCFVTDDDHISVDMDDDIFYSLKGLNDLRRSVISILEESLRFGPDINCEISDCGGIIPVDISTVLLNKGISFLIRTFDQLRSLEKCDVFSGSQDVSRVYFEEDLFADEESASIIDSIKKKTGIPVYAALSFIRRKGDDLKAVRRYLSERLIDGLLVRNLEDLATFKKNKSLIIIADFGLYSWNVRSSEELCRSASGLTLPLELSGAECRELAGVFPGHVERVIYGRAPLMISANCVRKTLKSCSKNSGFETIIDRKGISFPVYADCRHCLNVIYNSVPTVLKRTEGLCNRIEFSNEDGAECAELIRLYVSGKISGSAHTAGWSERPVM